MAPEECISALGGWEGYELLGWLDPYARVTKRQAERVSRLCAMMLIRHVADYFGLNWKTVKNIDKRSRERRLGPVDLKGVTVIGMDEFAIQRGHRYATVVIEPARKTSPAGRARALSRGDTAVLYAARARGLRGGRGGGHGHERGVRRGSAPPRGCALPCAPKKMPPEGGIFTCRSMFIPETRTHTVLRRRNIQPIARRPAANITSAPGSGALTAVSTAGAPFAST